MLKGRRVLIGICGGIAAYKVCELISKLFQAEAEVRVILTAAAQEFITSLSVTTLSRHPAYTDEQLWQPQNQRPLHIHLGEWADLLVIAPLTAHTLAKLAHGLADNLLTNTVLASHCPILLAPAMNTQMWEQARVQSNWQQVIEEERYHHIGPGRGLLACDHRGAGRMAEPRAISVAISSLLYKQGQQDLKGKRVLISAGGTREYLDPVRFLGNPSTGKMGVAIAQAASWRGAQVTLVHGPITEEMKAAIPASVATTGVVSAEEMQQSLQEHFVQTDWLIMTAAVADVKPAYCAPAKLAKQEIPSALPLAQVDDIIAELGSRKKTTQKIIGFAAQTGDIVPPAREKLQRKGLDAIVANPVDQVGAGFGSETNQAVILASQGEEREVPPCSKLALAHYLLDFILNL